MVAPAVVATLRLTITTIIAIITIIRAATLYVVCRVPVPFAVHGTNGLVPRPLKMMVPPR